MGVLRSPAHALSLDSAISAHALSLELISSDWYTLVQVVLDLSVLEMVKYVSSLITPRMNLLISFALNLRQMTCFFLESGSTLRMACPMCFLPATKLSWTREFLAPTTAPSSNSAAPNTSYLVPWSLSASRHSILKACLLSNSNSISKVFAKSGFRLFHTISDLPTSIQLKPTFLYSTTKGSLRLPTSMLTKSLQHTYSSTMSGMSIVEYFRLLDKV